MGDLNKLVTPYRPKQAKVDDPENRNPLKRQKRRARNTERLRRKKAYRKARKSPQSHAQE